MYLVIYWYFLFSDVSIFSTVFIIAISLLSFSNSNLCIIWFFVCWLGFFCWFVSFSFPLVGICLQTNLFTFILTRDSLKSISPGFLQQFPVLSYFQEASYIFCTDLLRFCPHFILQPNTLQTLLTEVPLGPCGANWTFILGYNISRLWSFLFMIFYCQIQ